MLIATNDNVIDKTILMNRFLLNFAYNGIAYKGLQVQPGQKTIQATLEKALKKVLCEDVKTTLSGRTDTGVHALDQLVQFNLKTDKAINRAKDNKIILQLNGVLPEDISVIYVKVAKKGFDVRKHAKKKTYVYHILVSKQKNPFLNDLIWRLPKPVDLNAMKKAAKHLVGKKDFTTFCAVDSYATNKVRELLRIQFKTTCPFPMFKLKNEKYISIEFTGNGFLKQMIRNIVGTLVEVGQDKRSPSDIKKLLKAKDRTQAGVCAPARGLYLKKVYY
ncbi:MAG: tRNA pseudouridine(38-40) synthase TruA [bacterium]|nr:tRNA pseudouridine(38-40) synthase TruA [bacterium]MBU1916808.1 tRNA pseudouridine(38-40) synthase TruA [bacterium]